MTKWNSEFDLEDRLIDFAVRIMRAPNTFNYTQRDDENVPLDLLF